MPKHSKILKGLISFFEELEEDGALERKQRSEIQDILKRLDHALKISDIRQIRKLIGQLSRNFQR